MRKSGRALRAANARQKAQLAAQISSTGQQYCAAAQRCRELTICAMNFRVKPAVQARADH